MYKKKKEKGIVGIYFINWYVCKYSANYRY